MSAHLVLIIPPIVGVVTYIVVRLIWERDPSAAVGLTETRRVFTLKQSDSTIIVFGDGIEDARPPIGQSNIQANYKFGSQQHANHRRFVAAACVRRVSQWWNRARGARTLTPPVRRSELVSLVWSLRSTLSHRDLVATYQRIWTRRWRPQNFEKERQIEKELDAASDKVDEMLKKRFNPKVLPLVLIGARTAGRLTPRPLARWIGRKVAVSDDKPTGAQNFR